MRVLNFDDYVALNNAKPFDFLGRIRSMSQCEYAHSLDDVEIDVICKIYKHKFYVASQNPFMEYALFLFIETFPFLEDLAQYGIVDKTYDVFCECEKYIKDGIIKYIKKN